MTTKYIVKSEASLKSSPENVSMSLNNILYLSSFSVDLLLILFCSTFIHLYYDYSVLPLCSFILPFQSFTFMDVVILVIISKYIG